MFNMTFGQALEAGENMSVERGEDFYILRHPDGREAYCAVDRADMRMIGMDGWEFSLVKTIRYETPPGPIA